MPRARKAATREPFRSFFMMSFLFKSGFGSSTSGAGKRLGIFRHALVQRFFNAAPLMASISTNVIPPPPEASQPEKSNRSARRSPRSAGYNLAIPESVIFPLAPKLELGDRQESDLEIPASLLVPTMSGLGYPPLPGR
uniref:Uncharacterized protein n=1 Tax=Candidatus Kentrum sp. LPFa TaxID=2126335 RepID=A0A450X1D3_9GAMM|nr:MAG: hypothetical protein BECKLPF1236B_GA0070989_13402 [Candidatus Kentron sp. LPFa]